MYSTQVNLIFSFITFDCIPLSIAGNSKSERCTVVGGNKVVRQAGLFELITQGRPRKGRSDCQVKGLWRRRLAGVRIRDEVVTNPTLIERDIRRGKRKAIETENSGCIMVPMKRVKPTEEVPHVFSSFTIPISETGGDSVSGFSEATVV